MQQYKFFILTLLLMGSVTTSLAQSSEKKDPAKKTILLLPDGSVLPAAKFDSLEKAWGKGRISFGHNEEDDAKGIIHLVQVTDEMLKQTAAEDLEKKNRQDSLLNQPAPLFELNDLKGNSWSLKELHGKIVVLNFWFTSCTPCIREMPELNKLAAAYRGDDVVFLALTFNTAGQVNKFMQQHRFDYTVLPSSQTVDELYRMSSWPTSMVIDREGYIRKITGASATIHEQLKSTIDQLKKPTGK